MLVDIQRKFTAETDGLRESMSRRIGTVNRAISLFRSTGNPIVYVFFDGRGSCLSEWDDAGDLLLEDLLPMADGDVEIHKSCMNAFNGTGLGETLRSMGVDCVLIAGLVAHYCVLATYFGAFDQELSPYILEGGGESPPPTRRTWRWSRGCSRPCPWMRWGRTSTLRFKTLGCLVDSHRSSDGF